MLTLCLIFAFQDAPQKDTFKKQTVKEKKNILHYVPYTGKYSADKGDDNFIAVESPVDDKKEVQILVCKHESVLENKWLKSVLAGDKEGLKEIIQDKDGFMVKGPCRVRVLQSGKAIFKPVYIAEIRILDGEKEHIGKTGWVPIVYLCRQLPKEITVERPFTKEEIEGKKKAEDAMKLKAKADYESKAAELLKHAKRWLDEGNKELAITRLKDLLKRFPESNSVAEAKKLLEALER